MQSTISSTEFYEGEEITLTATPNSGASANLFYWVINFTTDDLQYSIQGLQQQGRVFKAISSGGTNTATGTVTITQQANLSYTLTPLLLQVPTTQYLSTALNTALDSNNFFADTGTTYNITWTNPPVQKTITGIVTWLRNWFNTKEEHDEMLFTDSGWQTCTLSSGYAVYTSGTTLRVRKVGKLVQVSGVFKNSSASSTSSTAGVQFATIPSGYRPSAQQTKICQGTSMNRWLLTINTSGGMFWARYGTDAYAAASAGSWFPYTITYMVD